MINIGLIGCGRISKNHFEAISAQPDARCTACCDIVENRARAAAEKYHIPFWTTDYKDMLQRADIDLIAVCTPSGLHPRHGIMAARHGKHVLTEKPMAVDLQEADQLIHVCREFNVKLFVVMQNRLNPAIQLLRRAYAEGRFGRIYMMTSNIFWTRSQEYYDLAPWRGTWKLDGGAFMNQASHYVDILQWMGGPVRSVLACTARMARDIEAEDTGSALLVFESGAIGSINVTMLTYPANLEGSLTLLGEAGTVRIGGIALNKIEYWKFADQRDYDQDIQKASTAPDSVYGFGHSGYYHRVLQALNQPESSGDLPVDGQEGRKSLYIISKISHSGIAYIMASEGGTSHE